MASYCIYLTNRNLSASDHVLRTIVSAVGLQISTIDKQMNRQAHILVAVTDYEMQVQYVPHRGRNPSAVKTMLGYGTYSQPEDS